MAIYGSKAPLQSKINPLLLETRYSPLRVPPKYFLWSLAVACSVQLKDRAWGPQTSASELSQKSRMTTDEAERKVEGATSR